MKKLLTLILLIIFSSFFLISPNKTHAANKCGDTCQRAGECSGADNECTLCQMTGSSQYGVCVSREEAYEEQKTEEQSEEEQQTEEKQTEKIENNNKCGDTCQWAGECSGADNECTLCQMTGSSSQYGVCVSREEAYGEQETTEQQAEEARDKLSVPDLVPTINKIVNYSMGIGGIIAFLLIVFGGFQIIVSGGNPERVKAGKEMITSAIAGLLLIIFAVFILRLIGYDILKIPGFGK